MARESLVRYFLFGRFIRAMNSHPVRGDSTDISVFKTILRLLKEGKQIILFPEGERAYGELAEIKPGIGMLLMRAKTVIIPTYIHGAFDIWSRDRKLPKPFGKTALVFGKPISWEAFAHLEKKKGQEAIIKQMAQSIISLKEWFLAGCQGVPP